MKEVSYTKEPEAFEHGIHSIQKYFHANNFFHGTFRKGTIDGFYFSKGLIDARRMFSIVKLTGNYSLKEGILILKITKSNFYYLMFGFLFLFGIASTIMMFRDNQLPKLLVLFPWSIVLLNYIIYYFGYRSREKEIIGRFEHFLGLEKDLLE